MNKKIFNRNSKMHWVSGATTITGSLLLFVPGLESVLDPKTFAWILFGLGVVNHLLRNVTKTAIDEK